MEILPFRIINGKVVPVSLPQTESIGNAKRKGTGFQEIFQKELEKSTGVKLSAHAMERLKDRNINLDDEDIKRLNDAMEKADLKGAKESVLLYKDIAFVASIKNKTIITAVGKDKANENIFTNIDSAVVIY